MLSNINTLAGRPQTALPPAPVIPASGESAPAAVQGTSADDLAAQRKLTQGPDTRPEPAPYRYYIITKAWFDAIEPELRPSPLRIEEGRVLISLTEEGFWDLKDTLHHEFPGIGGIVDVTDEVEKRGGYRGIPTLMDEVKTSNFEPPAQQRDAEVNQVLSHLDMDRYKAQLTEMVKFPERYANSDNGVAASQWLADQATAHAKAAGRDDVEVSLVQTDGYKQPSVVIRIPGTTDKPGVLVGGHLDTMRARWGRNKQMPGADDDASGTIAAMETMNAILDSGMKFERDIYITFYAAEEVGLVGSRQVAKKFTRDGIELRAALQFDMIGYRSPRDTEKLFLIEDNTDPLANAYARDLASRFLGMKPEDIGSTHCNYACSDHASWHKEGVPVIFPFETSFRNINPDIHSSRDTVDNLDFDHAEKYIKLGTAYITELAGPVQADESKEAAH